MKRTRVAAFVQRKHGCCEKVATFIKVKVLMPPASLEAYYGWHRGTMMALC